MKKLLSLCLVAVLLLGLTSAFAAKASFKDVPETAWYCDAVSQFAERGLVKGVTATKFDPQGTMTRAMALTILWRWNGSPDADKSSFRDVPANSWYAEAAAWGEQEGHVNGIGDGLFAPNMSITREQLAAMIYRLAEKGGVEVHYVRPIKFTADDPVSAWAEDAMRLAITGEIILGRGTADGPRWYAKDTCTRAEAVTMLYRFSELYTIMPLRRHLENDVLPEADANAIAAESLQRFAAARRDGKTGMDTVSSLRAEPQKGLESAMEDWLRSMEGSAVESLCPLVFQGLWANETGPSARRSFYAADGSVQETEMVYSQSQIYLENEQCAGYRLQVLQTPFALAVLIPKDGVTPDELLAALDGESLRQLLLGNEYDVVHLTFPPFSVSDGDAVLDVNGGGINVEGGPDDSVEETYVLDDDVIRGGIVHADRPFVYILMDTRTNLPLFIGVMDHV